MSDIDRIFSGQQRDDDEQIAAFRQFYEDLPADERAEFRAWLTEVEVMRAKSRKWNVELIVNTQFDEYDANDTLIRWADCKLLAHEMLSAMDAWDRGENYAPG